jgi:hypothetical protein
LETLLATGYSTATLGPPGDAQNSLCCKGLTYLVSANLLGSDIAYHVGLNTMLVSETMVEIPQGPEFENTVEEALHEPLSSLSVELSRISAEIHSINSGFQSQVHDAITDSQKTLEEQFDARLRSNLKELRTQIESDVRKELRREFEMEIKRNEEMRTNHQLEIARAGAQLEVVSGEILRMLDDADCELSATIRKKSEEAELKAYLRGLQYSITRPTTVPVERPPEAPSTTKDSSNPQSRSAAV